MILRVLKEFYIFELQNELVFRYIYIKANSEWIFYCTLCV